MQQVIDELLVDETTNYGGFCYFSYCPIEWLAADIVVDFETGEVLTPVTLLAGKSMYRIKAIKDTAEFEEKEVVNQSGSYFEQSVKLILNKDSRERYIITNTLRYHRLLVIHYDNNKVSRIIGNIKTGMQFKSDFKIEPKVSDKNFYSLELSHQSESRAPIYAAEDLS
jgi:hypothetical protein